jgi:hypothetical protein
MAKKYSYRFNGTSFTGQKYTYMGPSTNPCSRISQPSEIAMQLHDTGWACDGTKFTYGSGTGEGEIKINLGVCPSGLYRPYITCAFYSQGNGDQTNAFGYVTYIINGVEDITRAFGAYTSLGDEWKYTKISGSTPMKLQAGDDVDVKIGASLDEGIFYRIDLVTSWGGKFMDDGESYPDGSFESGEFGDGTTRWFAIGNVRITDADAYSGTYSAEFFG